MDASTHDYGVATPTIGGATSSYPILTSNELDHWKPAPKIRARRIKLCLNYRQIIDWGKCTCL